jgi:hypothetical protein
MNTEIVNTAKSMKLESHIYMRTTRKIHAFLHSVGEYTVESLSLIQNKNYH